MPSIKCVDNGHTFQPMKEETSARHRANKALDGLCKTYYQSLPLADLKSVLSQCGFYADALDGIYTGREGRSSEQVGLNSWFTMTWYKMESGRYEVVAYLS